MMHKFVAIYSNASSYVTVEDALKADTEIVMLVNSDALSPTLTSRFKSYKSYDLPRDGEAVLWCLVPWIRVDSIEPPDVRDEVRALVQQELLLLKHKKKNKGVDQPVVPGVFTTDQHRGLLPDVTDIVPDADYVLLPWSQHSSHDPVSCIENRVVADVQDQVGREVARQMLSTSVAHV